MGRQAPFILASAFYALIFGLSAAWVPRLQPISSRSTSRSPTRALQPLFSTSTSTDIPRLDANSIRQLEDNKYVVVNDFIPKDLLQELRDDVQALRANNCFNVAKIGQDATNALNTDIRIAETCFIGPTKLQDQPVSPARNKLYQVLDTARADLAAQLGKPLDDTLSELLYAYYPKGGFYRRHRDAVPGSASVLRTYSLLLYLNPSDWNAATDKGELRLHFDSGGDELPAGEAPNYEDVVPTGGTLVLFESDKIPHEVLDTQSERAAVVGWYNRPVAVTDIAQLSGGEGQPNVVLLAVAAALVTVGVVGLFN